MVKSKAILTFSCPGETKVIHEYICLTFLLSFKVYYEDGKDFFNVNMEKIKCTHILYMTNISLIVLSNSEYTKGIK